MDALLRLFSLIPGWDQNVPAWASISLAGLLAAGLCLGFISLGPVGYVYVERKLAGFMQDRLGPMRVGPWGLLQTIADTIKLLFKEAIFPAAVNRPLFVVAPCLVVIGAFMGFAVLPFSPTWQGTDLDVGAFYVIAIGSLSTVGLIMAGWASNNKYALFGAMRSAAQIVSYEIPAVMSLIVVVMIAGSLSLQQIVAAQAGGLHNWFLWKFFPLNVIAFLVFFTATLAECNRTPFDIPEAESELVAGFHTEYSGFFFAMFFLAEYTEMFVASAMVSVLFLGGFAAPLPVLQTVAGFDIGPVWLIAKAWALVFVHMWLRWTLPRLRVDQLMHVAWKVLLPIALFLIVVIGGLLTAPATAGGFPWDPWFGWPLTALLCGYLMLTALRAWRWHARQVREAVA
ncbi:MAG: NADH-quinone oxidoreductase subunit NuoH [Vicinamibacteria bacterium]|nr:NADH-quinone oxidoreductase subunit NuoH [Vicinamibacteria bacterium]